MANPNTFPSDGRITSLQNYTAPLAGTELLMLVAPGNAAAGVNYNVTITQMLSGVFSVLPAQPANVVLAGPTSGAGTATPAFRSLVLADIPAGTASFPLVGNNATTAPSYQLLTVPGGGIGTATLPAFGVALGNTTGPLSAAIPGAAGLVLTSNNATSAPSFKAVSLTAGVTGVLPVVNGGSGTTGLLLNGVVLGNATAFGLAAATTSGLVLLSQGSASAPIFQGGVLTNIRRAQTTTYTLQSTDNGATIALAGNAFYTATFATASGYPSSFAAAVVNEDSGRAKLIALNGGASLFLWPLQSIVIVNQNNVWRTIGNQTRWLLPSAATVFVDAINGSDTNDGLGTGSSGALQTLGQAIVYVQDGFDLSGSPLTVSLASGVYSGSLLVGGPWLGTGGVTFNGASAANVSLTAGIEAVNGAQFNIGNLTVGGGANSISSLTGSYIGINAGVVYSKNSNALASQNLASQNGEIELLGNVTIAGGAAQFVTASHGGIFRSQLSPTITIATSVTYSTFVSSQFHGDSHWSGTVFSLLGTATVTNNVNKLFADTLSFVATNSGTTSFFPGTGATFPASPNVLSTTGGFWT